MSGNAINIIKNILDYNSNTTWDQAPRFAVKELENDMNESEYTEYITDEIINT